MLPNHFVEVDLQLTAYRALPANWDRLGSSSGNEEAIDNAQYFINSLPPTIAAPTPSLASDGSVVLLWDRYPAYVRVQFDGGTLYEFEGQGPWNEHVFGEETLIEPLDDQLLRMLEFITSL